MRSRRHVAGARDDSQDGRPARGRHAGRRDRAAAHLDAFYASVEKRDAPALRGRSVIAAGGVVLAASYEAKIVGYSMTLG